MNQQCPYCQLISRREYVILETENLVALLSPSPVSQGHALIVPKQHCTVIGLYPDELMETLCATTNKVASILFEKLQITGTNIAIKNGVPAGQEMPHFALEIIPRRENDGLPLTWSPKEIPSETMENIYQTLSSAVLNVEPKAEITPPGVSAEPIEHENNYLYKQLDRVP